MQGTVERANQLLQERRVDEAADLLEAAAAKKDAEALFTLAQWRIGGQLIRRDLAEARRLMRAAGETGKAEAALVHAYFLASGTGGEVDWAGAVQLLATLAGSLPDAAEQLARLEDMGLDELGFPRKVPERVRISDDPHAFSAVSFLTPAECAYLVRRASPRLRPTTITDRATGRTYAHPVRRAEAAIFGVTTEDLVVGAINRRIAALTGTPLEQGEALEVISYGPGGEFRPHSDALPGVENQRILTAITYLTDSYCGGETRFVRTGLDWRGGGGDVLVFSNCLPDHRPDPRSEHAGMPVTSGRKVIATRWIRAAKPSFPPPAPASQR